MSAMRRVGLSGLTAGVVAGLAVLSVAPSRRAAAASEDAPTLTPAPPPSFDLKNDARVSAGKRRFAVNCAGYCHGSDGSAGRGPSFLNRPDFDPKLAFVTIRDGRKGSDVMPPWGGAFSTDEIWELVAYLGILAQRKE